MKGFHRDRVQAGVQALARDVEPVRRRPAERGHERVIVRMRDQRENRLISPRMNAEAASAVRRIRSARSLSVMRSCAMARSSRPRFPDVRSLRGFGQSRHLDRFDRCILAEFSQSNVSVGR